MKMWMKQLILLGMLAAFSGAIFSGGSSMTPSDAQGDWEEYEDFIKIRAADEHIKDEMAGKQPPGGVESWNEFWLLRLKHMRKDLDENQKYINYIIKRREEAGLPPLKGYSPKGEDTEEE